MQHDRAMTLVVGPDVFQPEALWQLEVSLNSAQLPLATDCITHVDIDLGAIERRVTLTDGVGHTEFVESQTQCSGCFVPHLVSTN